MKILALNSSYRAEKGYTRFLLDLMGEGIKSAGGDYEVIDLANLKINHCLGCDRCHTQDHYLQCVWNGRDDVQQIFDRMAGADVLIYATPVYVFSMSALLKTFLERMYATSDVYDMKLSKSGLMFHHVDETICSKPFALLVCCDNLEDEIYGNILSYFKSYSRFMDAPRVGVLVRNGGRLSGFGANTGLMDVSNTMEGVYQAFRDAGFELGSLGYIKRDTQRRASREIVPLPLFGLLKKLLFRPLKEKIIQVARSKKSREY